MFLYKKKCAMKKRVSGGNLYDRVMVWDCFTQSHYYYSVCKYTHFADTNRLSDIISNATLKPADILATTPATAASGLSTSLQSCGGTDRKSF